MMKPNQSRRYMLKLASLLTLSPATVFAGRGPGGGGGGSGGALSAIQQADLLFMREEEKLARDVYLELGDKWGSPIFSNIAASEQRHMDRILGLLNTYRLTDPAAGMQAGEFHDPGLQSLYQTLTTKGRTSALAAMQVGALIEETDINDLREAIARTGQTTIKQVYTNLLQGSYNHLVAFVRQIESMSGARYLGQVLSAAEIDQILNR